MKKKRKIVKGNHTTVDKDEKITPLFNKAFPLTDIQDNINGAEVDHMIEEDAKRLRDFSIENKK